MTVKLSVSSRLSVIFVCCLSGQAQQNDEIKEELEGIIGGLQTYLSDIQHKADGQREECDGLIRDREELAQRVHDLEKDKGRMEQQAGELSLLKQVNRNIDIFNVQLYLFMQTISLRQSVDIPCHFVY